MVVSFLSYHYRFFDWCKEMAGKGKVGLQIYDTASIVCTKPPWPQAGNQSIDMP